jgi:hypothetical protein
MARAAGNSHAEDCAAARDASNRVLDRYPREA